MNINETHVLILMSRVSEDSTLRDSQRNFNLFTQGKQPHPFYQDTLYTENSLNPTLLTIFGFLQTHAF